MPASVNAWARTLGIVCAALLGGFALGAQLVAALAFYDPALGPGLDVLGGARLYQPWALLTWTWAWLPHRPWLALLLVGLMSLIVLAALALGALLSGLSPPDLARPRRRAPTPTRALLGQSGLLRAEGLALGAVRRLGRPPLFLRHAHGHRLLLGEPRLTDDALIAALSGWDGALVFVDGRGGAARLARADALRWGPGRVDAIAYNPLLAIRSGAHAWSDARLLGRALLETRRTPLIDVFAALALDLLITAPIATRTLAGLRQSLIDPARRFASFCTRWADADAPDIAAHPAAADPAGHELVRIARAWRRDGTAALALLAEIDARLAVFADGDHARATSGHQLRMGDLVADAGTLVISPDPQAPRRTAPLIAALLAQAVAACARPQGGHQPPRRLLIVLEADALDLLAPRAKDAPAPLAELLRRDPALGCEGLAQARCVSTLPEVLSGARSGDQAATPDAPARPRGINAIAAIGPQSAPSAAWLSARAGAVSSHVPDLKRGAWRTWLLPRWLVLSEPALDPAHLRAAEDGDALLLLGDLASIHARALIGGEGHLQVRAPETVPSAPHAWTAPPAHAAPPAARPQASGTPPAIETTDSSSVRIRRALSRRAAPRAKSSTERRR